LNLSLETVESIYTTDPLTVRPDATVREVFQEMKASKRGAALVCDGETLLGIFTERDALKLLANKADLDVPISDVMTKDPVVMGLNDTVGKAIAKMSFGGYRRLPIVDDAGHAQGFVKASDVLHYLVAHFPAVVYNLPPSPHHSTQEREGA
jgi:CBS domain-containing protein